MEVLFANKKLKSLCESKQALQDEHGQACARRVMGRLQDLEAVASLADVEALPGTSRLRGSEDGRMAIEVDRDKRLVVMPTNAASDERSERTGAQSVLIVAIQRDSEVEIAMSIGIRNG